MYIILILTDQSEETAALTDLVDGGANLLKTLEHLLKDIHMLDDIDVECKSMYMDVILDCVY